MSADPEIQIFQSTEVTGADIGRERSELQQAYDEWINTTEGVVNVFDGLNKAKATGDPSAFVETVKGYLVLLVEDSAVGSPLAAYQRAQAATINLVPHLAAGLTESELFDQVLDQAQKAINSPAVALVEQKAPEEDEESKLQSARIRKYLAGITAPELVDLSPQQQNAVDKAQKAGLPISNLTHVKRYRKVNQLFLIERAQQGDEFAMEQLCINAVSLVSKRARDLLDAFEGGEREMDTLINEDDLIQEGLVQVPKVVGRYKFDGSWFSPYLGQRVSFAFVDYARSVSSRIGLTRANYSVLETAISAEDPNQGIHELMRNGFVEAPQYVKDGVITTASISLEALTEDASLPPLIAADDLEAEIIQMSDNQELEDLVNLLPDAQRYVIASYYGMCGVDSQKLHEIGVGLGFGESRASQLHSAGLNNLRRLMNGEPIKGYPHPRAGLANRYPSLTRNKFIARVSRGLKKLAAKQLTRQEIALAAEATGTWEADTYYHGLDQVTRLNREMPPELVTEEIIDECLQKSWGIRHTADGIELQIINLTAKDMIGVFEIDQRLSKFLNPTLNEEMLAKFSPKETEVLNFIHLPAGKIAQNTGVQTSTARTHIHNMMKRVGVGSKAELAIFAARNGLIDLESIEFEGTTAALSAKELYIAKNFCAAQYDEAARQLGISISTIRSHWHHIYAKTKSYDRVQVALLGLKEGLIPLKESGANGVRS